jgi:hypothetical protein
MDRWDVIPPGEIIIIATDITSKAAVHNHTLSAVKALFD